MRNDHTFIICVHKQSPFLEECVLSLLNQSQKSNIIAVTSTPNNYIDEILNKYNIPLHKQLNGSIAKDWNFALSCADTKYATIAHQDDIYCTDYAKNILQAFDENQDSLIAFCNYKEIINGEIAKDSMNMKIKKILQFPLKTFNRSNFFKKYVQSLGCSICCPSVSFNLENLSGFKFNEEMTVCLDWEAWYRISQMKGSFCYVPKVLMHHRMHDLSETTNAIKDNRRYEEDVIMFSKFWPKPIVLFLMQLYKKK